MSPQLKCSVLTIKAEQLPARQDPDWSQDHSSDKVGADTSAVTGVSLNPRHSQREGVGLVCLDVSPDVSFPPVICILIAGQSLRLKTPKLKRVRYSDS